MNKEKFYTHNQRKNQSLVERESVVARRTRLSNFVVINLPARFVGRRAPPSEKVISIRRRKKSWTCSRDVFASLAND